MVKAEVIKIKQRVEETDPPGAEFSRQLIIPAKLLDHVSRR